MDKFPDPRLIHAVKQLPTTHLWTNCVSSCPHCPVPEFDTANVIQTTWNSFR